MEIINNKGKVVFSGEYYPAAVVNFFSESDIWVSEESVLEFLSSNWEGTDHENAPLAEFFTMCPEILSNATNNDTILTVNGDWYVVHQEVENSDSPEAVNFWQNILSQYFPGYKLNP